MDLLSRSDVLELVSYRNAHCVSIYMPTYWGMDVQQGPIRLRNLADQAEESLVAQGVRKPVASEILLPIRALVEDSSRWRNQGGILAVFAAPGFHRQFQVPVESGELVTTNGHFHVKPLLRMLGEDGLFYVLALSTHKVRLLQCTRHGAREVSLEGYKIPMHIDDVLKYDVYEKAVQFHTQTAFTKPAARRGAMFHGTQGYDQSVHKEDMDRFVQAVARGMHQVLHREQAPLVLACVDRLFPMYREHSDYARLLDRIVPGNPDRESPDALRDRAWEIVSPIFRDNTAQVRGHYERALSQGLASDRIADVVSAAAQGRVGMLLVSPAPEQWGRFDSRTGQVDMHIDRQEGDEDLCDVAAMYTMLNSGMVYSVTPHEQPDTPVAAIYRW